MKQIEEHLSQDEVLHYLDQLLRRNLNRRNKAKTDSALIKCQNECYVISNAMSQIRKLQLELDAFDIKCGLKQFDELLENARDD